MDRDSEVERMVRLWAGERNIPPRKVERLVRAVRLLLAATGDVDDATLGRLVEREYRAVNEQEAG